MTEVRVRVSDRLLRAGVEMSVDRYEMARRAEADSRTPTPYDQEGHVLLLTGWVSRAVLWLARLVRPTQRVPSRRS